MNLKEIIEKQEKPTRLDSLLKPKSQKQERAIAQLKNLSNHEEL